LAAALILIPPPSGSGPSVASRSPKNTHKMTMGMFKAETLQIKGPILPTNVEKKDFPKMDLICC
jgi:hypothetical protein